MEGKNGRELVENELNCDCDCELVLGKLLEFAPERPDSVEFCDGCCDVEFELEFALTLVLVEVEVVGVPFDDEAEVLGGMEEVGDVFEALPPPVKRLKTFNAGAGLEDVFTVAELFAGFEGAEGGLFPVVEEG